MYAHIGYMKNIIFNYGGLDAIILDKRKQRSNTRRQYQYPREAQAT